MLLLKKSVNINLNLKQNLGLHLVYKNQYVKNKLLKKFINKKDPQIKAQCHEKYKKYRNLLSTLLKESKHIYYTKYFESNWNNIRNIWKGIKTIISLTKKKLLF